MTGGRRRRLATAVDDGLNPFHCSFRGSTLSLPALHPLQVTPPRKSVAIHPVIPLSLPAFSYLLPPCTPHCSLAPPHSFDPTAHRVVYQPLRSTHTHTYTDNRQVFVAKVTPQGNGRHLVRVFWVARTSTQKCLVFVFLACKVAKYLVIESMSFCPFENIFFLMNLEENTWRIKLLR